MISCMGYILEVNLTTGEIKKSKVPDEVYDKVLSGKGLGVWYCYNNIPADADPLGPDNVLGITSGALTGTGALFCGRWTVVGKSPLTGGWGDASGGGMFAPAIKQCGVDAIFFKGISEKPVYLYMDSKKAELRDASEYWGLDASDAEDKLTKDTQVKKIPRIAVIGQAGENLSLISGICNEHGRISARSGLGAVMGSKKLKAIVLAGSLPVKCADSEKVKELSKELGKKVKKARVPSIMKGKMIGLGGAALGMAPVGFPLDGSLTTMFFKKWGTPMNQPMAITSGDAPLVNWAGGPKDVPGALEEYDPDKIVKIEKEKYHCYSCPMGCGGILDTSKLNGGEFSHTHKPEYETINQFGPLLKHNNLEAVLYINELLNRAGMDSISAGATVAFAIECYENGLITTADTDGLELNWGNSKAIVALVKKMIAKEGNAGKLFGDGTKAAMEKIGKGCERFAMMAGGQELPAHDSRNDPALAIHYVTEPAPGKHTIGMTLMYSALALSDICTWAPKVKIESKKKAFLPTKDIALATVANACYSMITDGAGACYYGEMMGSNNFKLIEYLNAAEGWTKSGDEYMEIGKRIQTLRQMFNIKQGFKPADVSLPNRALGLPALSNGPLKGVTLPYNKEQQQLHWECFGWDKETGVPTEKTIKEFGIDELTKLEVI